MKIFMIKSKKDLIDFKKSKDVDKEDIIIIRREELDLLTAKKSELLDLKDLKCEDPYLDNEL